MVKTGVVAEGWVQKHQRRVCRAALHVVPQLIAVLGELFRFHKALVLREDELFFDGVYFVLVERGTIRTKGRDVAGDFE